MARPKNPENKYEPRYAKLGIPVLDEKGALLTFNTKHSAEVNAEDIKAALDFFDSCASKDSSFKIESAIESVFKLKEDVSENSVRAKSKTARVSSTDKTVNETSTASKIETEPSSEEEKEEEESNTGAGENE